MRISDWSSDVCSSDLPLGGIDHDRHPGDVGFGGDQVEELHHRRLGVEHALVHVDVDHLGTILDLLACDGQCRLVVIGHVVEVGQHRSEEHTSELQSLMRTSYAVFCLKKKQTH